ncbi:MAG: alanine--tRNA ligase [Lachnospiraceae bacterium]|nr:alanine--tRNA ligase [Lachnospiraceae bacterium]MEE1342153.1 alanine--tRNA ligase [Lachnospiraceae bacterium]
MKQYGLNELRSMYLNFFEGKGHLKKKSFSLIPHNDKSLLLINSGMAPLKPYFTGQEIPPRKRITTCQKCIRTGDIENVGKTARHGTFFEMLGNFSFGDYFKEEAIEWSWEFLTEVIGLEADRLYPSVYEDDDEAFKLWNEKMGIPAERIFKLGKEDNFWEHGAGPCGPCSEIYYDRGEKYGCHSPNCTVGCDCDRYMEIWNNVFTQFENDGNGNYTELVQKNIDTGMGLERLAVVVQDVPSIFDVDTIKALRDKVCEMAHVSYLQDDKIDVSIRLITDHIRSITFMLSDGIRPTNEGRGYVLRRLLRRAARHGRLLNIKGNFLAKLSETVIEVSKEAYPELEEKKDFIFQTLENEEASFNKTIDQGLAILSDLVEELQKQQKSVLSGEDAFKLYDTYGFPLDLTEEILEEKQITVDKDKFNELMEKQRTAARDARETTNYMGADVTVYQQIDPTITSTFVGYETLSCDSAVTVIATETDLVDSIKEGEKGTIFTTETPFYATSGGQEHDTGVITTENGTFKVNDTIKVMGDKIAHIGEVVAGEFKVGQTVTLTVDQNRRELTGRNHSATHLLQKALKLVLGGHVEQAGSNVNQDRLRFDFAHFQPMTKEEIKKVEAIVNEEIQHSLAIRTDIMDIEDAKKTGAMALFGEKYSDKVRVVSMGEFSKELCGGTHVANTSEIGYFKILSESGVAAGTRRIEAITSVGAFKYFDELFQTVEQAAKQLKAEPSQLMNKLEALQSELKSVHQENEKLKAKLAKDSVGNALDQVVTIGNTKALFLHVKDIDMNELRNLGDDLKEKISEGVVLLASEQGTDKVSLIAMATEEAMKQGAHAGNLIKEVAAIVGGGGGGRPNMAQAGGKIPAKIEVALQKAKEVLTEQLK